MKGARFYGDFAFGFDIQKILAEDLLLPFVIVRVEGVLELKALSDTMSHNAFGSVSKRTIWVRGLRHLISLALRHVIAQTTG